MPLWLTVLLLFLATHRVTRLLVEDKIPLVAWPREKAIAFLDPTPEQRAANPKLHGHWGALGRSLAYLLECPWCMSMYVGGVLVAITAQVAHGVAGWLWVLVWLAASTFTGFTAGIVESEHELRYRLLEAQARRAEAEATQAEIQGRR